MNGAGWFALFVFAVLGVAIWVDMKKEEREAKNNKDVTVR